MDRPPVSAQEQYALRKFLLSGLEGVLEANQNIMTYSFLSFFLIPCLIKTTFTFEIMIGSGTSEVVRATPPCGAVSSMSEMAMSPASAASSNHFPFTLEMSGLGMYVSTLESTFPSGAAHTGELQPGSDGVGYSSDPTRSLEQLWNFSLSDLTADFSNLGDSHIMLGSAEQDGIVLDTLILVSVEEYFTDVANGSCRHQFDEEIP